jgi:hypothetical protein
VSWIRHRCSSWLSSVGFYTGRLGAGGAAVIETRARIGSERRTEFREGDDALADTRGAVSGSFRERRPNASLALSQGGTIYAPASNLAGLAPEVLALAGGDQTHNNLQPYLTFYFCIALQGVFPPRS